MSAPFATAPDAPPVVGRYRVIPLIEEGAASGTRPHPATPEVQRALGFPETLPADWKARALTRLGELVAERRGLRVFLETCTKCGACTDKCHYYLGTRDPKNMPVARQDLLRAVWRRHFTFAGALVPVARRRARARRVGARGLVPLLPPVLRVPPLHRVLPERHRHERGDDGRARDPRERRPRPALRPGDRRQGDDGRQQPRHEARGARRHAREPRGGHPRGDRRRRAPAARRPRRPTPSSSPRRPTSSPSPTSTG